MLRKPGEKAGVRGQLDPFRSQAPRHVVGIELARDYVMGRERDYRGASADRRWRQANRVIRVRELAPSGGRQGRAEPSWVALDPDLLDEVEGVVNAGHPG